VHASVIPSSFRSSTLSSRLFSPSSGLISPLTDDTIGEPLPDEKHRSHSHLVQVSKDTPEEDGNPDEQSGGGTSSDDDEGNSSDDQSDGEPSSGDDEGNGSDHHTNCEPEVPFPLLQFSSP
jgi:hypothetical protein